MEKIRNFGRVTFNKKKSQIEYSYYFKDSAGDWKKEHKQKTIQNQVYLPNTEAVLKCRAGDRGGLVKDLWGNEILVGIPCEFYDRNPPEVVKKAGKSFSSDINPVVKFLSEDFEFDEQTDEIPPLKVLYLDIETAVDDEGFLPAWQANSSRGGINLISCFDSSTKRTTSFGIKPLTNPSGIVSETSEFVYCVDERSLLRNFMTFLKRTDPEILTGWNVSDYDIPYILNRLVYIFDEKALWHFGNANAWIKNEAQRFIINGIAVVDYMVIYKKFELSPRRSFSLANIAEEENITIDGQGKHTYEGSLNDLFENDWDAYVKYCIQDTKLVERLNQKKNLMETFILLCYMAGISFDSAIAQDVSWLRIHDAAIYRYCQSKGLELPTSEKIAFGTEAEKFAGAYIMAPKVGLYGYTTIFDVSSLYPSCMRSLNISMDSFRGMVKHIYTPGNEDKPLGKGDTVFSDDFNILPGKYEIELYPPIYLSLKEQLEIILTQANEKLRTKVNPTCCNPKTFLFKTGKEMLDFLKKNDLSIAANGAIFTKKSRGIIPSLLDEWMAIRKKNKNLYFEYKKKFQETGDVKYKQMSERYNTIQNVYKIRLNSLYGFVGTRYSRFFDVRLAEAVTLTGQSVLKSTMNALRNANVFFTTIYCDTDSIFLNYQDILKHRGVDLSNTDACVAACLEIDKEVKTIIETHLKSVTENTMNAPNFYSFESEEIYSRFLITSKKKYIAEMVYDKTTSQTVENNFTIKGMEFKKSNLSKPIKAILKDLSIRIMRGLKEEEVLAEFKRIWMKLPEFPIDDLAYAQGTENVVSYGSSSKIEIKNEKEALVEFPNGCPFHIKGAIALNALIDWDKDLRDMTKVVNHSKPKIIFVTPKNIFGVDSISYAEEWNPKLYEYFNLDVEKLFMRLILQPLQPILDAVKFKINLDSILGFRFTDCENKICQLLLF